MARLRAPWTSLRRGKAAPGAPSSQVRRGKLLVRVLVCSAAVSAVTLLAVPGSRSFASELASKIVHLRPGATAGPIPFILDLHKHKRPQNAHASSHQPARPSPQTPARLP